jgi:hypothetical protein
MKKITLSAIGLIAAMASFGQFKVGVQAISNLSSASVSVPDVKFTKTMRELPGAGIVAQYDASEKLSIRSGINYLQHGVIVENVLEPSDDVQVKAQNTLHYLQLPVNVLYNIPVGKVTLFAGVGGFVNYGVGGTTKQTTREFMQDETVDVTVEELKAFKKEEEDGAGLKKFDFGASALAGVKLNNGIFANLGYQMSLANISEGEGKYKNQGLQLTVGYLF